MLRITIVEEASATRFVIEGRLVGPWVGELRKCWQTAVAEKLDLVVDLTGVTLVDLQGKALLTEMSLHGTQLLAKGLMTQAIIEEIQSTHRQLA
jgi:hypothetical protein